MYEFQPLRLQFQLQVPFLNKLHLLSPFFSTKISNSAFLILNCVFKNLQVRFLLDQLCPQKLQHQAILKVIIPSLCFLFQTIFYPIVSRTSDFTAPEPQSPSSSVDPEAESPTTTAGSRPVLTPSAAVRSNTLLPPFLLLGLAFMILKFNWVCNCYRWRWHCCSSGFRLVVFFIIIICFFLFVVRFIWGNWLEFYEWWFLFSLTFARRLRGILGNLLFLPAIFTSQ